MTGSLVSSWIASHARRAPGRVALDDLAHERSFTYAELDARVEALVGHLLGAGVGRGDRVALLARNSHHAVELQEACARLGAVFVPLGWRLTEAELVAAGTDCGPRFLLHESFVGDKARAVATALDVSSLAWDSDGRGAASDDYESALAVFASPAARAEAAATLRGGRRAPTRSGDPWTIIYTSGTTGTPKGVVLSHASATATMLGVISAARVQTDAVSLTVLPFCHVAGLNLFTNPTLFMGGRVVIMRENDPAQTLALLRGGASATAATDHAPVRRAGDVPVHAGLASVEGDAARRRHHHGRRRAGARGADARVGRARLGAADGVWHLRGGSGRAAGSLRRADRPRRHRRSAPATRAGAGGRSGRA